MSLLVFGQTGQVAQGLRQMPGVQTLGRADADLRAPADCAGMIRARRPEAVINAAGWTAVDDAEDHEAAAHVVNADAPGAMATACACLGIPLVHLSTDYVFDGSGDRPFAPGDPTGPLNAYGRSKLAGEQAVRSANGVHVILRTSWVFSAHGANFVKTMLRLGATRETLPVVADQIGGPTPADALAAACLRISAGLRAAPGLSGTYHLSGVPDASWAGFAAEIFAQADLPCAVTPIPTTEFPTKAARPTNSRLCCDSLQDAFGIQRPDWRVHLAQVLSILKGV
ncbi:dTDP-4-dehydrorhamnose reductase [Roseovarius sp.]|uniref:dTDP-4-dehydrorhamnose reductase n=1 Tax=Roseovarius sp. TaxID=1486281 RepID=UPI0035688550